MSIAFMFSGQGSQYVTMCQELYEDYDVVKELFAEASTVLGYDVKEIMFHIEELLHNTLYTQPLLFVMYVSIVEVLRLNRIESTHTCGLSLGEYGALYDSGCFDFKTGLELLKHRGFYMEEACQKTVGKMSAILGMDADDLHEVIQHTNGYVTIANYNTYGQLVISGEEEAVYEVNKKAIKNGAKRAILLQTSGPFHSKLMNSARLKFGEYLNTVSLQEPRKKLLTNVNGGYYVGPLQEVMSDQITNSVYFYQMIETLLQDGVDTFVEIGPKKVLSSFVKKIDRTVLIVNVEDRQSLHDTIKALEV